MVLQTYAEAVEYLYSFVNWEVAREMRYTPDVMTLDRPRRLLAALGDPHATYPIIHITGTKGKGSVGAMCAAACHASGLRTGLYSSPHLQDFRERFRLDNELISEADLIRLVNRMKPALDAGPPDITWFEVATALAFLYFADQRVDIGVVEVGLGGRLDATNVVMPTVSVITSLSFDHTRLLGESLASIAREKAGIIKPGVPVVSAPQPPEALAVIEEVAAKRGSPLTLIGRDWTFTHLSSELDGTRLLSGPAGSAQQAYRTGLVCEHQALNAAVALAALHHTAQAGVAIYHEGIRAGMAGVDWPGRLEVLPGEPTLVLDAAHNGESAWRLRAALDELFPQRPRVLLFGASADKDVAGMFEALLPSVDALVAAQAVHPRALSPDEIDGAARKLAYGGPIERVADTRQALERACALAGTGGLVCVTGSLFVVGEVRTIRGLPVGHVKRDAAQAVAETDSDAHPY